MEEGRLQVARVEHRAEIRINHPPTNTLNVALINQLAEIFADLRDDEGLKLIVLKSDIPEIFSDGLDCRQRLPEQVGSLTASFGHLVSLLNEMPVLVACEVDGPCLGGSLELAMFADFILASSRATFGHPEIRTGLFPPVAAALYPHLIGRNRTMELLCTGRPLQAEEALNIGLINHVFPVDEFTASCRTFYDQINEGSASSLRITKRAIEAALYEKVIPAVRITENIYLNELLTTRDAQEGLAAKIEGRAPNWTNS